MYNKKRANSHSEFLFNKNIVNSKRSQSEIITTVLIILLVLAAIVIVWQVVKSTVSGGAEKIGIGATCIEISLDITKADANSSHNSISVTRKSGGEVDAIDNVKFLVNGVAVTATNPTKPNLGLLESGVWTAITPALADNDEVEVAALLSDGVTYCDVSDSEIAKIYS